MTPLLVRSMLLVFLASVVGSFGAVFLKMGALRLNKSVLSFVNSRLVLGVGLYLGSSIVYALGTSSLWSGRSCSSANLSRASRSPGSA